VVDHTNPREPGGGGIRIRGMDRRTLHQVGRAYLWSFGIWGAISLLTGWGYHVLFKAHSTLLNMMLVAGARGFAFASLTPPIFHFVRRYGIGFKRHWWHWSAYVFAVVPFVLLYSTIRWLVLPPWDYETQRYISRSLLQPFELIRTGFADQIIIFIAIVVAAHAYGYFGLARKQELEAAEFQKALAVSELQALKMQLHPHFLFNTLHGISTLVDTDPACAKAMLVKLSTLLRTTLQQTDSDSVPLREELKFIEQYLDLEKMRLGARLTVNWSIDPDTLPLLVPQLILQPLVENAIRHGIGSSRERGWVAIASHRHKDVLELCVSNSVGPKRPVGTGIGLRNTEARLAHLYSGDASLSFRISEEQTAIATLLLPALGFDQPVKDTRLPPIEDSRDHAGVSGD